MNVYIKAAALGLAVTAMGATGAIAGKTTTPNPTSPPGVTVTPTIALSQPTPSMSAGFNSRYVSSIVSTLSRPGARGPRVYAPRF